MTLKKRIERFFTGYPGVAVSETESEYIIRIPKTTRRNVRDAAKSILDHMSDAFLDSLYDDETGDDFDSVE